MKRGKNSKKLLVYNKDAYLYKNISYLYGRLVGRSIFHGSYYGLAFFSTENTSLRFFPMLLFDGGNFTYPF